MSSPEEVRVTQFGESLTTYFNNDDAKRFVFEGHIGNGIQGNAWKLRYKFDPILPSWKWIVLKTDIKAVTSDDNRAKEDEDMGEDADPIELIEKSLERSQNTERALGKEKRILTLLQWAKHVVRILTIPDDPLKRPLGDRPRHLEDWLYLEWVENGTVFDFVKRAINAGYETLPNRVLWRFFLCLIRMAIAMAWPPAEPPDSNQTTEHVGEGPPKVLTHNDIHNGNVMIGPQNSEDPEHDITPMLKLIDFGYATEEIEDGLKATQENVYAIGRIMVELITFENTSSIFSVGKDKAETCLIDDGKTRIRTMALHLLPNSPDEDDFPHLDPELKDLVIMCMAETVSVRPSLPTLVDVVIGAIKEKDTAWYAKPENGHPDPNMETDGYIDKLFQDCLSSAPLAPASTGETSLSGDN